MVSRPLCAIGICRMNGLQQCKYNYAGPCCAVNRFMPVMIRIYTTEPGHCPTDRRSARWRVRHHCLYIGGIICFTGPRRHHSKRRRSSASSNRSSIRNNDRPAATATNGSVVDKLVQLAGIEVRWPFAAWKYTRSSPQLRRY